MERFCIADLHFDGRVSFEYDHRPFNTLYDMNRQLIDSWCYRVRPQDECIIVGDFADCDGVRANELLHMLPGKKFLVRGNHDAFVDDPRFDKSNFGWIKDYAVINGIVYCHYPIRIWARKGSGSIHIHGHIHTYLDMFDEPENSYNCAVTINSYRPVTLDELKFNKNTILGVYNSE